MKALIYSFVISTILLSCNGGDNNSSQATKNKDSANTKSIVERKTPLEDNRRTLLSNIKSHYFSDGTKKDTFKLVLTGDSLITARAIFSITSYEGKTIYVDTFSGADLTKNVDGDAVISDKEKLMNIKESVKSFFNDSAFSNPPVFDNDGNETTYWDDIKSDKTAIGFEVAMNHVDFRIAYSKNQHKVLMYWNDAQAGD